MSLQPQPKEFEDDLLELLDDIRSDVRFLRITVQVLILLYVLAFVGGIVIAASGD